MTSAGKAKGVLKRDRGSVYAGIMLDHDLQRQCINDEDRRLSGSDLVDTIIHNISKKIPILVHSTNLTMAPIMAVRLENAKFRVTRIPMHDLTKKRLLDWVEEIRESWEEE